MKHWVIAYRRVWGTPAALRRRLRTDITELLRTATGTADTEPDPDGSILLDLPARVLGRDLHKQIRVRVGVALDHGDRTCIPLRWEAEPGRHAFPTFRGTVELEPTMADQAQLTLVGAVTPPLGPIGAVADATFLHALAERTTHDLADRLADALASPEPAEIAGHDADDPGVPAQLVVHDVMTPDPLVLHEDTPLRTAALLLLHFDVAGAPVQTDDGGLVGVLSESDLMAIEAIPDASGYARAGSRARTVGQICTRPARTVTPDATLADASRMMWEQDLSRLVVVSGAQIVGIVSRHDVLRAVTRNDAETQAAVDHMLEGRADGDVVVAVEWGIATVKGNVARHSTAQRILRDIRAVDGVVGVESSLEWEDDDLLPPVVL